MLRKLLIVACLCGPVLFAFAGKKKKEAPQASGSAEKINYKETGAPLPLLNIFTREGKHLTEKDLKNDANLIIMLFNPTCDHCQQQAGIFKEHIDLFRKSNLVLVAAPGMVPHLGYFTNVARIGDVFKIQVGVDSAGYVDKTFMYQSLPQINIYDKERKLIRMFYGATPIDSLRQYIE